MLTKFILYLLALVPNHELNKSEELRTEVEGYFVESSEKFGDIEIKRNGKTEVIDLEPEWLLYYANKESSLLLDQVGTRGEVGYAQAHGKARKICELAGYDPTTRRGGAMCMGLIMNMGIRRCGSFNRGMAWYASGSCNRATEKMAKRRASFERKWAKVQSGELDANKRRLNAMKKELERQRLEKERADSRDTEEDAKESEGAIIQRGG